jgi:hypothetical protein
MRAVASPLLIAVFALFPSACGGDADSGGGSEDAGTGEGIRVSGFSTPESVLHDEAADVYLVSNINGGPLDEDDNGFISRVSPAGEIQEHRWIDGGTAEVELHAPKGMAVLGDNLYVADIDCIRVFDRTTGVPVRQHCLADATFLNDVAVDGNGVVYFTDSGLRAGAAGFEPSGTDAIYRLSGGSVTTLARGPELGAPNGISFGPRGGFVVTFGSGEIYQIAPDGSRQVVLPGDPGRQLDGIVFLPDGGFLFSSWGESAIFYVGADGAVYRAVDGVEAPADIGFDASRGRVLVPLFNAGEVLIREVEMGSPPANGGGAAR